MKNLLPVILCCLFLTSCGDKQAKTSENQHVISSDIDNFWNAYDKIVSTKDTTQQLQQLNTLFLDKGTPGLKAIMQARQYTAKSYLDVINSYPRFWQSIRANTHQAKKLSVAFEKSIQKLNSLYPDLKPAKIYLTMGALRTNGTTIDSLVLIGSELAMADKNTVTSEFPETMAHLRTYFDSDPIQNIVFLNTHEYVHTQQKTAFQSNLLVQCIREGVAEFIAEKASNKASSTPAIAYGTQHNKEVLAQFEKEMFNNHYRSWLWSNLKNKFNTRDLGYYIGYAIAQKHYNSGQDKKQALKTLIELDYGNDKAIESFVDQTRFFSKDITSLKKAYTKGRPKITSIKGFENKSENVSPDVQEVMVNFSEKMDTRFRGFDYGPLGEKNVLRVRKFIGFSEDGKSVTFEVKLKPNQRYQLTLSNRFSTENGTELKPYLIDIKTSK